MTRGREPLYLPLLASSGTWVALCAGVLFLLMLAALFGPFDACGGSAMPGFPPRVGIWIPPSTPAEALRNAREIWRASGPVGAEWHESSSLDELAALPVDVAVVPNARQLDAAERGALERYVAGGGAAVVCGSIGVRGADGTWLGWDAMQSLLGERVTPLPREQSYFLAAGPRGPLTAGLDPGQRLALAAEEGVPALEQPDAPLHWARYTLEPVGGAAAALLAQQRGVGRLVWLAAGPEYAADAAAVAGMARVAAAALAWAGRLPVAEIAPWPTRAPFAALLAMDTEERFENAAGVARIARRDELPITFLAVSDEALKHPALTAELVGVGEMGSHGDRHVGFGGEPPAAQRERLERTRRDLESLGAPPLRGFRPPMLSYDDATLETMAALRFDYLLGDLRFDRLAPTFERIGNGSGPLVQMARGVRDDVDLILREGVSTPEALAAAALADARRVARSGGLYYFSFHTHLLAVPERVDALSLIGRGLRAEGAWLARGGELADWWRARAGLSLQLRRTGPRRIALSVSNDAKRSSDQAVVHIYLQRPVASAALRAATALQGVRERWLGAAPELRFERGAETIDLALPPIPPGQRIAWNLDWSALSD